MTKLYFNDWAIKNNVIPSLNVALNNLNAANRIASSMNIPSDFNYINELRQCNNSIALAANKVNSIKSWLNSSTSVYSSTIDSIENSISNLSSFDLEIRNKMIG